MAQRYARLADHLAEKAAKRTKMTDRFVASTPTPRRAIERLTSSVPTIRANEPCSASGC
jgi:hypothetical protein